jgi:hypothetical protein
MRIIKTAFIYFNVPNAKQPNDGLQLRRAISFQAAKNETT